MTWPLRMEETMSYDVDLEDDDGICEIEPHEEGGTYVLGGTTDASLNITYNYSKYFYEFLDTEKGLRGLDGKKAQDVISKLENAVKGLGTEKDADYWKATPGNAGHSLSILLQWAKQHPNATFKVF